jgi:hypothetical protein
VTLLSFSLQMSSFGIICDPIKPFNYVFFSEWFLLGWRAHYADVDVTIYICWE